MNLLFCLPHISLERYCQKNVAKVGGFGKVNKGWYGYLGE